MKRLSLLLHVSLFGLVLPTMAMAQSAPNAMSITRDERKLSASEALAEADAARDAAKKQEQSAANGEAGAGDAAAGQAAQAALPTVEPLPASKAKPFYDLLKNDAYEAQMGSLFFSPEQQTLLDRIYRLLEQGKKEEAIALAGGARQDPMDTLMGKAPNAAQQPGAAPAKPVIPPDVPMFYLSSIMYISPNEWALWVNGKRFSAARPGTPDGKFEVIGISPTEASFVWTPYRFAQISALIKAQRQQEESAANAPTDMQIITSPKTSQPPKATTVASSGRLGTDESTRRIFFTLRTNQSFFTLPPRIAEGLPFRDPESINQLPLTTVLPSSSHAPLTRQVTPQGAGAVAPGAAAPMQAAPAADVAQPAAAVAPVAPENAAQEPVPSTLAQPSGAPSQADPLGEPAAPNGYRDVNGVIQRQ